MAEASSLPEGDKHALFKAAILLLGLLILYRQTLFTVVESWAYKPQVSHGYAIVPLVVWLCWLQRHAIGGADGLRQRGGSVSGLLWLAGGLVLHGVAQLLGSSTLANAALMISLAGVVIVTLGVALFRALLFPYLFLLFMFPIPDALYLQLSAPLKLWVSQLSTLMIKGLGIPVVQEGNVLQFVQFQMEVVEACSGMRSLVSYLMLAALLAHFLNRTLLFKVSLLGCAVGVAMFNNLVRIVVTAVLAHHFGESLARGFYHEFTGLVTFAGGFVLLTLCFRLLSVPVGATGCATAPQPAAQRGEGTNE